MKVEKKQILITGSAGLIGSEAVRFFGKKGFHVVGIDNNMRQYFFGYEASTSGEKGLLEKEFPDNYIHYNTDIRNYEHIKKIFNKYNFDLIIHTAAQPSHDWAAREPITDFTINANGTLILLENYRKYCPNAVFIFTSTNKVYGDTPNLLPLIELEKRYEIDPTHKFAARGIDESMSIDNSKHSLFGASKVAADLVVQEYGKYYGLKTGV
ncbi:MAG TPA: NAD-dependent epimerase/dehydratase family protein, partial [Candidatus Lokiarchaeia archaeon]